MRCLSVLDLVILFYLFIFFLGREAQKVREWGQCQFILFLAAKLKRSANGASIL